MKPIRVYDSSLNMLTETDNYLSLQFNPRFYEVGEFELHINQYVEGAEYFVKGNLIVLDKREDKAMLIRHREIALDQNGKVTENWRVTGVTLKGVLDQRVTIPPESTSHDRISGNAETVMKHYVDKHFVNPADPARKIDYIEIAEDQGRGVQVEWESRFKNVADELAAISKQANLGWIMYADIERKTWIFDVVEPRDVTQNNEAGLQPVFFSPDFSTIKTQQFVDSDNNYRNVAFIGGQGEGVERKIVKIGESEGMDLHEVFIDARDVSDTDDETEEELSDEEYEQLLIERGERRMREFETTFYLEAQILTPSINRNNDFAMSTPFEYETDFRLGDLVQVFNKRWNITMDAPITEFMEIHEPGGFILEAIFGEAQPTLITKIRDKFNELEGIEKQELPARLAVERMRDAMRYGDERLSEEEQARIEQALEILDESKEYADEEAYQAEKEAKRHADDQDIVYDEKAQQDASEKSDNAREDAKQHADQQDDVVRDDAARDATDKADRAEENAKGHADDRADEAERNAKNYTDENAVDRGTYEVKMQEIADDFGDKAGIEYVDGQLQLKADSDVVQAIDDTVSGLQGTAADLEQAVIDHADALAEQDGRIIDVETDLDTVEGNLSLVITDLSNLDDTVSQQGIDINANAEAISLKANQDDLDTVSGDVSSIESELTVMAGEIEAKAERSTVEGLRDDLDGLEIGGRNLIIISQILNEHNLSSDTGEITPISRGQVTDYLIPVTEYKNMTVSRKPGTVNIIREDKTLDFFRVVFLDEDEEVIEIQTHNSKTPPVSFDVPAEAFYVRFSSSRYDLENLKVEHGNKATDWTPAPEDIDAQFNTVTNELGELTVSVEGIEGNVSNLTQTVSDHGTEISDLESARLQHADLIEDRVTKTEYSTDQEGIIQEFENIESFRQQHEDWINDRVTSTTFDALEGRMETAEGQITTQAGLIEAKADSSVVDGVEERVISAELTIDGLEGEITSKVEADDVRSIFTQEAGSFTFDADQINFDGHVFGEDATFSGRVEGGSITSNTTIDVTTDLRVGNNIHIGDPDDAILKHIYLQRNGEIEGNETGVALHGVLSSFYVDEYVHIYTDTGLTVNSYTNSNNLAPVTAEEFRTTQGTADVIVDQGSNADGHYIRYTNGVQICWENGISANNDMQATGSIYRMPSQRWDFPMPFIDSGVSISGTVQSFTRWFGTGGSPSATGVSILQFGYSSGSAYSMNVMAIGRWR